MTPSDLKALSVLGEQNSLVRPGYFGTLLWPETKRPTWAFARPAGRVLNRLKAEGFAEWLATGPARRERWGWQITQAGRCALADQSRVQDPLKVKP